MKSIDAPTLEELASAKLPTRFGDFRLVVFSWDGPSYSNELSREHCALVRGNVFGQERVLVRIHSECLTSEVFGSLRCDCKQQLEAAQQAIAEEQNGVVLYLRQEGRGIGLTNKVRAYALQEAGADTVDANLLLHLPIDARQYDVAAAMLKQLGVKSIRLLTNNPNKLESMERLGIEVIERVPTLVEATQYSAPYLDVKRDRLKHALPKSEPPTKR